VRLCQQLRRLLRAQRRAAVHLRARAVRLDGLRPHGGLLGGGIRAVRWRWDGEQGKAMLGWWGGEAGKILDWEEPDL
jgi:hypothetical protein